MPTSTSPRCRALAVLFLGLLVVYSAFHHDRDWNSASRLLLTYALVQERTIEITSFTAWQGRLVPQPPTMDLSSPGDGRFFCDKAPVQSFLGAPIAWVAQRWFGLPIQCASPEPPIVLCETDFWVTWATSGLAAATTALLLASTLATWGAPLRVATGTGLAFGLATTALVYATHFYGHVLAGMLALLAILTAEPRDVGFRRGILCGLVGGAAVLTEYPLIVVPLTIGLVKGVLALRGQAKLAFLPGLVLGGLPLAGGLLTYNWLVSGSAWRVPYTNEVYHEFALHGEGLGLAVGPPTLEALVGLLVGTRGLLWVSPVLLAAFPGFRDLYRWRGATAVALVAGSAGGLWALYAGFPYWDGSYATGPRYLVPLIPLLMLPVGAWLASPGVEPGRVGRWLRRGWVVVAVGSGGMLLLITAVGGQIPPGVTNPITEYVHPVMARSGSEPHFGHWALARLGFPASARGGWLSTIPLLLLAAGVVLATLACSRAWPRQAGARDDAPSKLRPGWTLGQAEAG